MRKLWLLMNVSLDGYFEAPGHDISWASGGFEPFSDDDTGSVDAFLFGHRTYDMMKNFWPTPQAAATAPEVATVMNEKNKFVVSHAAFEPGWNNVTVLSGDDVLAEVQRLKDQPGGSIAVFGSNNLCVTLLREGLLDELHILVNPVLLGTGTSLFTGLPEKAALTLTKSQSYPSGATMLTYVPIR